MLRLRLRHWRACRGAGRWPVARTVREEALQLNLLDRRPLEIVAKHLERAIIRGDALALRLQLVEQRRLLLLQSGRTRSEVLELHLLGRERRLRRRERLAEHALRLGVLVASELEEALGVGALLLRVAFASSAA